MKSPESCWGSLYGKSNICLVDCFELSIDEFLFLFSIRVVFFTSLYAVWTCKKAIVVVMHVYGLEVIHPTCVIWLLMTRHFCSKVVSYEHITQSTHTKKRRLSMQQKIPRVVTNSISYLWRRQLPLEQPQNLALFNCISRLFSVAQIWMNEI